MTPDTPTHAARSWRRLLPFLQWWPLVTRESLRADLMAGLTGAVIVLPQGVAFAMVAGLPPVYGLYTAMVPAIVAGLFGSSRHLISGPTTAISIVVFASVSKFAEPGSAQFIEMALTLTFLAGVYQLALGVGRMGTLVNFISHSVVVGFTAGAAVLIATNQLKHYFGVAIPSGESFLHTWQDLFAKITGLNPFATLIATLTLATTLVLTRLRPRWPVMLIAMVLASLVAFWLGAEAHAIKLVGHLPQQLPPLSLPDLHLASFRKLASSALAVAMLGLVEAVSIARSVAAKSGQRIDGNQEFIGQGLANIAGSFVSSYASSGSFTRSGLNYTAGAVTPMSAVFAAVSLLLIVLLVAPLAAHLPIAAMSAVLLVVAWRLIDVHQIQTILKTSKRETAVLLTTFAATLFVELEFAIYVGVMLSLIIYLMRTSQPHVLSRVPDATALRRHLITNHELPECPQLKIIRIDGSIYFGAVDHIQSELHKMTEASPRQKHLLLIGNGINFIDIAGAELLAEEARRRRAQGGGLYLAKLKDEVCTTLRRGGFRDLIGERQIFPTKADGIAGVVQRLDEVVCGRCDKRIFVECARFRPSAPPPALDLRHLGALPRCERILVASDDSESSAAAVKQAVRLARKTGAQLRVIYVHSTGTAEMEPGGSKAFAAILDQVRGHLDAIEREAGEAGVVCDTEVVSTNLLAHQEILRQAQAMKADVIVLGRRQPRGSAYVRIGNTAARVIGASRCPVLIVPRDTQLDGVRIVLATDGSAHSDAAAVVAAAYAKIWDVPVVALSATLTSHSAERQQEALDAVHRAAHFFEEQEIHADAKVLQGRPEEAVAQTVEETGADLIVVGTHGRTGLQRVMLGSVSERIVGAASTAVLIVRGEQGGLTTRSIPPVSLPPGQR